MTKLKVIFSNFFKSAKNDDTSDQHLLHEFCAVIFEGEYTPLFLNYLL